MTFLLLEGPDGGGKSVLGAELEKRGFHYQHNGPPPKNATVPQIFWWQLAGLQPLSSYQHTVVDRSWPSDQFYHRYRPGAQHVFDRLHDRMFQRYFLGMGGQLVICLPPFDVAYMNWRRRADEGKELLTEDWQFAEMYEFYRSYSQSTGVHGVMYDYTKTDVDGFLANVADQQRWRGNDAPLAAPADVTGYVRAPILVVGERCNAAAHPEGPHLPFFGPSKNNRWLAFQFERLGVDEYDLCWVNAQRPDGSAFTPELLRAASGPAFKVIIALGETAARWTREHSHRWKPAMVLEVPHPAYWTRFHAGEPWPLLQHGDLLRAIRTE